MKICPCCQVEKDVKLYNKNTKRKDGKSVYCKECISLKGKENYIKNKNKVIKKHSEYYSKNKKAINARIINNNNKRYSTDLFFKMKTLIRNRIRISIKRKMTGKINLLGCSVEQLQRYIESLFQEGMSWENWSPNGWHLDHIKPLASFDLSQEAEILNAYNFNNLQPLWAKDNISKGAKYSG